MTNINPDAASLELHAPSAALKPASTPSIVPIRQAIVVRPAALYGLAAICVAGIVAAIVVGPRYIQWLPEVNASLNATATVLLIAGLMLIKSGRERAHTWVMLWAFVVSILFLGCYLVYHAHIGSKHFEGPAAIRAVYYIILLTHVVLAATVPFLAGLTIYWGLKDRRVKHRAIAQWAFPIWLYVSVTGVVIYWMLYHLYSAVPA